MAQQIEVYSAEQAAEMLDVSIDTMRRLLHRGVIRGVKVGREWRIHREVLESYLKGESQPATADTQEVTK